MNCQSCLIDPQIRVVVDASIVINLNASGFAATVLRSLPSKLLVVNEVVSELEEGIKTGRKDLEALKSWAASGDIEIVSLGSVGLGHFESLVSGAAVETLDDGEAATIAYAVEVGAIPTIDERKANRICGNRFPQLTVACSLDIFGHKSVSGILGATQFSDALFNALKNGRMRVPPQHLEWVIEAIGKDRASTCHSLPREARKIK